MRTTLLSFALVAHLAGAALAQTGPTIGGVTLSPSAGSITNTRVAQVAASVSGNAPPFSVTFLVDGVIESQIQNLAAGEQFRHGISLVGGGPKRFTLRARDAAGATSTQDAGSVTLDTTGPAAPILLTPVPIVSNQNTLILKGIHPEPPRPGATTTPPKVLVLGPSQARFSPTQPQDITDPNGQFQTTIDVTNLPDGSYSFRLIAIDAAGNFSETSSLQFKR